MEEPMAQVPPPAFVEGAAHNDLPELYDDRDIKEKKSIDAESADVVAADAYFDPRSEYWRAVRRRPHADTPCVHSQTPTTCIRRKRKPPR